MEAVIPTLRVAAEVKLCKARCLPVDGDVLVDPGERVAPGDLVARASVRGEAFRVNLVEALGLKDGESVAKYLLKSPGDAVSAGEEIARGKGGFVGGKRVCTSPIEGTIASGPTMSGDILIAPDPHDIEVQALLPGQVVGILPQRGVIVESVGAYVQCVTCVGGECQGTIKVVAGSPAQPLEPELVDDSCTGAFLVAGSVTLPALRAALFVGVGAVIVGSVTATTFQWLRDNSQPVTVIITEGFGAMPISRRTFDLFRANAGRRAYILGSGEKGANSAPAEIFIPAVESKPGLGGAEAALAVGSIVRIVRGDSFGALARVVALPDRARPLGSGVRSEIARLSLEDGQEIVVGRGNIEVVE
ncbi:MAG: hypothetical protein HYY30_12555 [Chloroflexi bacterium]|nr:hypothetical protein [Chloroflexota bacterium]